ncbi:MAG: hypothetical protein RR327_05750 [Clostridia bacterium]
MINEAEKIEKELTEKNKKDERKFLVILCVIVGLVLLFLIYYGIAYSIGKKRVMERYEVDFDIEFPLDMREVSRRGENNWQERGNYLFIYKFKEEPKAFLKENHFSTEKNYDMEEKVYEDCTNLPLGASDLPNFAATYYWRTFDERLGYKGDTLTVIEKYAYEITMVYCPGNKKLYLID